MRARNLVDVAFVQSFKRSLVDCLLTTVLASRLHL